MSKSWKRITKQSNYNELIDLLTSFGYQKTSKVEEFGQYRISGSIIDFFSIISNKPTRINFFEDKIETIKENIGCLTEAQSGECRGLGKELFCHCHDHE